MSQFSDSDGQYQKMMFTPIPKLVTSLSIPTVLSQLIMVVYNTADTYFVSQINTSASAAVGVSFSLMAIIQAVGFGLGMGANSLASRCLGAKRDEEATKYCNSALFAGLLCGCLITLLGLPLIRSFMRLLGATSTILPYACDYSKYVFISAPMMCMSFVLNNILRAEGAATLSMIGLCCGGVINIFLDPILIFQLDMGISGAAIATLISMTTGFLILLSFFFRGKSVIVLHPSYISKSIRDYLQIVRCGIPTIFRQGMASVSSALLNVAASGYGDASVAAITIANKVYMLVRNVVIGVGQGFQPVAGYNFGAKNPKRVRKAFYFSTGVGTVFCLVCSVILAVFAPQIMHWFRDDPQVIAIGTQMIRFECLAIPVMAYSTYVNQMYQCLGFSTVATILACCRQGFFFIPLVLILPRFWEITGIQLVQALSDILTFAVSIPFQIHFFKKQLQAADREL